MFFAVRGVGVEVGAAVAVGSGGGIGVKVGTGVAVFAGNGVAIAVVVEGGFTTGTGVGLTVGIGVVVGVGVRSSAVEHATAVMLSRASTMNHILITVLSIEHVPTKCLVNSPVRTYLSEVPVPCMRYAS
jgi:hypothetical protein